MRKITTILLDMYGVILEESKGNFIPYTFKSFDQSEYDRLTRQFREEKLFTRAANGEMTSDEFLTRLGFEDPRFHMINYINNFLTLDPGFREFAEKYYRQYDFVLLSNDVAEWSAWITEHHDLDQYFTHKIVSGDVKCRKPDRKIYEIALEKADLKPEEIWFCGDTYDTDIEGARAAGITPVFYQGQTEKGPRRNSAPAGGTADILLVTDWKEFTEMLARPE